MFKDPAVISFLNQHFVSISVNTDIKGALAKKWRVKGLPLMWFLKPDSEKINSLPGYVDKKQFLSILNYIQSGAYDKMSFHEFTKKQ